MFPGPALDLVADVPRAAVLAEWEAEFARELRLAPSVAELQLKVETWIAILERDTLTPMTH
jgi:hypothetical protein